MYFLSLCYCCCSGEHGRFSVVGESSLRIDSVMEPDTALYTCRAANGQDFIDSHALLTVHGNGELYYCSCNVLYHNHDKPKRTNA